MKKLTILFALLTLSMGLWATTRKVSYRYPVYIDNDATKGIQEWKTGEVEATVVESAPWGVTWDAGWYVVTGEDVQLKEGAACKGAVNLILADGAKLTATGVDMNSTPGIQVSGDGNSLTVYGQANQTGQLITTGGNYAAGIGGGNGDTGSNITINGGIVTATGGDRAAGIGGGYQRSGSNITINGGEVTATGGLNAAGIGGGKNAAGSNIKVATYLIVKAGNEENPTKEIATDRTDDTDIASSLAGKQYATTEINFSKYKTFVIAAVNAEITESDNDNVKAIATDATTAINAAASVAELNAIKDFALAAIASARAAYAAGLAEAAAALPTDPEGTTGHTVTITKGDKTLILVNPDKVIYGKQE